MMKRIGRMALVAALAAVLLVPACEDLPEEPGHNNPVDPEYGQGSDGDRIPLLQQPPHEASRMGHVMVEWGGVPDADFFNLQAGLDTEFGGQLFLDTDVEGRSLLLYQPVLEPADGRSVYWRVRARVQDQWEPFSEPWRFEWDRDGDIPELLTPENGVTLGNHPVFRWEPVSGAVGYTFQLAFDEEFQSMDLELSEVMGNQILLDRQDFQDNTTYFWRVQTDFDGGHSDWSAPAHFNFSYQAAIGVPELYSPSPDEAVSGSDVYFDWSDVTNAEAYRIEIASDDQFSSIVWNNWINSSEETVSAGDISSGSSNFWWRVAAIGPGSSQGDWSATRHFSYSSSTGPAAPFLDYPWEEGIVYTANILFQWSQVSSATDYGIQIATDAQFTDEVFSNMTTDTEMEVFESDLNAGPGYYWRVRSIESGDSGPWSDAQFFRHFPEGSSVLPPLLNAPADGSTVSSYDVILEWQAESGAQRYGFEVAEDNQFQFLVYEDVVPGTTPTVTGDALMSGTQYYWRVRSIDDANSSSNWSAVRSFQYSPGGGGVGLVLPQDGESLTGNVYFEWQSYTGSEFLQEYVLLINDTQDFSSPLYNASMGAGTSVTVQASHFGAAGTYYWEVVTQTDGGDYSSERRSFSWSP